MSEISGLPAPDTAPSKALRLPLPPAPTLPSTSTLRSWLPLYLHKSDRTITRLEKILSTSSGSDTLLMTICYTSLLASSVLSSISLARLHRQAREIIEKAISLPPNTTVLLTTASIPPSRLLIASKRLKALSSMISDFRLFARLWGLLGIYTWGKGVWNQKGGDGFTRSVAAAQVLACFVFQYLENMAYLSSKRVMGWSPIKQNKAWAWSSRFWAIHVGLDFVRLGREYVLRQREKEGSEEEKQKAEAEWTAKWVRSLIVNAAWAPLTLHWSFEQGLISEFWVGVAGSVAGVSNLSVLWKKTA